MQRNRAPPRTAFWRRKRRKLHHRLRNRRILPPTRILHPQRRPTLVPNPLETAAAQRPRARIPRFGRKHPGRRARLPKHTLHTAHRRAQRYPSTQPFARRQLFESACARGPQERESRHRRCSHGVLCRFALAQHENHYRRPVAPFIQRALVSFDNTAAGLVGLRRPHLYEHVVVLLAQCGR
jgi:hypothetical protein